MEDLVIFGMKFEFSEIYQFFIASCDNISLNTFLIRLRTIAFKNFHFYVVIFVVYEYRFDIKTYVYL